LELAAIWAPGAVKLLRFLIGFQVGRRFDRYWIEDRFDGWRAHDPVLASRDEAVVVDFEQQIDVRHALREYSQANKRADADVTEGGRKGRLQGSLNSPAAQRIGNYH